MPETKYGGTSPHPPFIPPNCVSRCCGLVGFGATILSGLGAGATPVSGLGVGATVLSGLGGIGLSCVPTGLGVGATVLSGLGGIGLSCVPTGLGGIGLSCVPTGLGAGIDGSAFIHGAGAYICWGK